MENIGRERRCVGRDSTPAPPECTSEAKPSESTHSEVKKRVKFQRDLPLRVCNRYVTISCRTVHLKRMLKFRHVHMLHTYGALLTLMHKDAK
jgi:hypothetical protein